MSYTYRLPANNLIEVDIEGVELEEHRGRFVLFTKPFCCRLATREETPHAVVRATFAFQRDGKVPALVSWVSAAPYSVVMSQLESQVRGQVEDTHKPPSTCDLKHDQALRYNQDKPQLSLLLSAPNALGGVAKVLEYGAAKYSKDNWKKGLPYSSLLDSLLRHVAQFNTGENLDPESGLPHVDHILCNALFLAELTRIHPEFDDRSKP